MPNSLQDNLYDPLDPLPSLKHIAFNSALGQLRTSDSIRAEIERCPSHLRDRIKNFPPVDHVPTVMVPRDAARFYEDADMKSVFRAADIYPVGSKYSHYIDEYQGERRLNLVSVSFQYDRSLYVEYSNLHVADRSFRDLTNEIDRIKSRNDFSYINLYQSPKDSVLEYEEIEASCCPPQILARYISSKYKKPVTYHYRTIRKYTHEQASDAAINDIMNRRNNIDYFGIVSDYANNILSIDHSRAIIVGSEFRFAL